jgi:hypothetical protein
MSARLNLIIRVNVPLLILVIRTQPSTDVAVHNVKHSREMERHGQSLRDRRTRTREVPYTIPSFAVAATAPAQLDTRGLRPSQVKWLCLP